MFRLSSSFTPEYLVVGLGNPGSEYGATRHNLGFRVADMLARAARARFDRNRFEGRVCHAVFDGQQTLLLKPQTYMNNSGVSVAAAADHYRIAPERILVIADDLDLPLGTLRIRGQGSAGGHKGLRSIIEKLGSQDFSRLRLGISRHEPGDDTKDYVLSPFTRDEEQLVAERVLPTAVEAVLSFIRDGLESSMSRFNRSVIEE